MNKHFYNDALEDFPKNITDCVDSPCFLISEDAIKRNLKTLSYVKEKTGAKILLALKAFAMHSTFPIIRQYLDGVCASGPIEARLGYEKFGKEVHTFAVAYSDEDIKRVIKYSNAVIFNSSGQLKRYGRFALDKDKKLEIEIGDGR